MVVMSYHGRIPRTGVENTCRLQQGLYFSRSCARDAGHSYQALADADKLRCSTCCQCSLLLSTRKRRELFGLGNVAEGFHFVQRRNHSLPGVLSGVEIDTSNACRI